VDVIREAARSITKALQADHAPEANLKRGDVMLSTLERMLFLRNVSFFENLQLDQLRALARVCREASFAADETIIRQGEIGDELLIIVEGQVRIEWSRPASGETLVLTTLGPSEVFGELSILDGGARSADAVAETPVLLLQIESNALHDALEEDPSIAMMMLRTLAQRLRKVNETLERYTASAQPSPTSESPAPGYAPPTEMI
jgi:CRP/FNR family transcriptional regulator/CRP/FNR family cyclic AMP-dependent transcriptional regulator